MGKVSSLALVVAVVLLAARAGTGTAAGSSAVTWTSVNPGQNHTCSVLANGEGWCWGNNSVGELGSGTKANFGTTTPQQVTGGHTWKTIDGGDDFTCGLDTSGAAWCWGYGWNGQLGDGTTGTLDGVATPQKVVGGHVFTTIAGGNSGNAHACAIDTAGAAWCWGDNTYGQLGTGTTAVPIGSGTPVAVVGGHVFADVAVSRDASCGIATDGEMWCWGDDEVGQLGDDAGAPGRLVPTPVLVAGGHHWRAVAVGDSHTCGVDTNGVAYCWGREAYGELGLGVAGSSSNAPAPVATSERFVDIGVGTYDTCAISTAGAIWCWGYNRYGTLGNGTKNDLGPHPTPTRAATDVVFAGDVHGGYLHMCALGADGQAYCWGYGANGEIGSQPEFCSSPTGQVYCSSVPFPVTAPATTGTPPPATLPTLDSLAIAPATVAPGATATGTVTLGGAAPSGGAVVALAASPGAYTTMPGSVTVPAGATTATFGISTALVTVPIGVTITAAYNGTSASAQLTIQPASPPPATADTVTITRAEYGASKQELRVEAESTASGETLTVYVTATDEQIGTLTGRGTRYSGRLRWPSNPQRITIRSSGGGSDTATVALK